MLQNYQIQRIYGFNLRGGFGVNRMVFYGKIGFGIVNGTLTTTGDSRNQTLVLQKFSETTKQQNYALHYGAGMEFFVTESFFLRAEYNEFNFSTKTLMNGISFNGDQVVYQSNHVLRNVVFGVGFKFF